MQFLMVDVYYEKEICYSDNINKKAEYYGSNIPFITIPDMHGKLMQLLPNAIYQNLEQIHR